MTGYLIGSKRVLTCGHTLAGHEKHSISVRSCDGYKSFSVEKINKTDPPLDGDFKKAWSPDYSMLELNQEVSGFVSVEILEGITKEDFEKLRNTLLIIGFPATNEVPRPKTFGSEFMLGQIGDAISGHIDSIQLSGGALSGMSGSPVVSQLNGRLGLLGHLNFGNEKAPHSSFQGVDALLRFWRENTGSWGMPPETTLASRWIEEIDAPEKRQLIGSIKKYLNKLADDCATLPKYYPLRAR